MVVVVVVVVVTFLPKFRCLDLAGFTGSSLVSCCWMLWPLLKLLKMRLGLMVVEVVDVVVVDGEVLTVVVNINLDLSILLGSNFLDLMPIHSSFLQF